MCAIFDDVTTKRTIPTRFVNGTPQTVKVEHRVFENKAGIHYADWNIVEVPLEDYTHPAFLRAALRTMCRVSVGRNHASRAFLVEHVAPFDTVLEILKNEKIHDDIRAAYANLVQQLYIDAGTLTEGELVLSRRWDDVRDKKASKERQNKIRGMNPRATRGSSGSGSKTSWNDELIKFVHSFFADASSKGVARLSLAADHHYHQLLHSKKTVSNVEKKAAEDAMEKECSHNCLTREVLHIAHAMVKFGFYSDISTGPKARKILQHDLLELLLGHSGENASGDEAHTDSHSHRIVTSTKAAALEVLRDLFHVYSNDLLTELLVAFRTEMASMTHHHLGAHAAGVLKSITMFSKASNKFLWFRGLGANSVDDETFAYMLLELCEYQDDALRMLAMELLMDSFNMKGALLGLLDKVTITADKEETAIMEGVEQRIELLLVKEHDDIESSHADMLPAMQWLSNQLEDTHRGGHSIIVFHQNMMRNEGALELVVQLLERHLDAKSAEDIAKLFKNPDIKHFYSMCFRFLGLCAHHNHENQKMFLEHHVFHFLQTMVKYGISAESVLTNVFQHESAGEHLAHKAVHLFVGNLWHHESCRTAAYFRMLSAAAAPGGSVDHDQQSRITKELFLHEREITRKKVLYGSAADKPFLFLYRLVKAESSAAKQRKTLKRAIKLLHAEKRELVQDHVFPGNGATYHDSFTLSDLTALLVSKSIAASAEEAGTLVAKIEAARVIYAVTGTPKSDALKPKQVYRFIQQAPTSALLEAGFGTKGSDSQFEASVEIASLFARLSDQNAESRAIICQDVLFGAVIYPLVNELFAEFSIRSKTACLKLARGLYLYHLDSEDIGLAEEEKEQLQEQTLKDAGDAGEETEGFGFAEVVENDGNTATGEEEVVSGFGFEEDKDEDEQKAQKMWLNANDDPTVYTKVGNAVQAEVAAVVGQLRVLVDPATLKTADPSFDLHLSDDFVINVLTPFLFGVMEHSIRPLESLAHFSGGAKLATTLSAAIESALKAVSQFYKLRQKLDVSGMGHVDHLARRHGARHLEHFINMIDVAEMSPVHLILQRHLDRFVVQQKKEKTQCVCSEYMIPQETTTEANRRCTAVMLTCAQY